MATVVLQLLRHLPLETLRLGLSVHLNTVKSHWNVEKFQKISERLNISVDYLLSKMVGLGVFQIQFSDCGVFVWTHPKS